MYLSRILVWSRMEAFEHRHQPQRKILTSKSAILVILLI